MIEWKSNLQKEIKLKISFHSDFKPSFCVKFETEFIITNLLYKSNHQVNKSISASQPILINRYQWIDFIQSKRWFSSENAFFP